MFKKLRGIGNYKKNRSAESFYEAYNRVEDMKNIYLEVNRYI